MTDQKALVRNAADEEQVKKAESKQKNRRRAEMEDLRFVLSDIRGRRALWRLLERCGVYRTSMTGNSQTYFLEGERSIGLFLLAEIEEANVDAFVAMIKESKDKEVTDGRDN